MQELLVDFITSLDGYGAAEGWPGWWGLEGPEYLAWLGEQPPRLHDPDGREHVPADVRLRRRSRDTRSGRSAAVDELARTPKVVFSSSLQPPLTWANTPARQRRRRRGGAGDEAGRRRPMRTLGSLSLCRSLLEAGLVDRFRVVVFPVITGSTGANASTTAIPTSRSTWSPAAPSTAGSSCSSTSPRCSPVHPARTPLPEFPHVVG